jgi:long-chain fatty acid transport protein
MNKVPVWFMAVAVITGLVAASTASATTGYFALGYGAKGMGLAGAVVSNPQDSASIASNPATITAIGERVDVGLRFFMPTREAELDTTAAGGTFDVDDKSRRDLFLTPNFGFNLKIGNNLWFGFNNYGNGGLNSTYDRNIYDRAYAVLGAAQYGIPNSTPPPALLCDPTGINGPLPPTPAGCGALVPEGTTTGTPDTGTLGVDLQQGILAPTLAMKIKEKHSIGVSLLIGVQRFSARGLGDFQCFTKTGAAQEGCQTTPPTGPSVLSNGLTNNASDWSYGFGTRIGWMGEVHPRLTLGASYSTKIYMTEFDDYDELFAEDGDFDIPANFTLGATFKATPKLKLSFDFEQIQYEGVNSISNNGPVFVPPPAPNAGPNPPCSSCLLGMDDGMGFGWEDINIYRVAAEYAYDSQWIFRAGYSWNDQPIPDSQVLFNILAPATIQQHMTVGFTFAPDKQSEWNFAYMHAFEEEVKSSQTAFGVPGSIKMHQNSFDVSYSYKF